MIVKAYAVSASKESRNKSIALKTAEKLTHWWNDVIYLMFQKDVPLRVRTIRVAKSLAYIEIKFQD